jgi:hypothetical protein
MNNKLKSFLTRFFFGPRWFRNLIQNKTDGPRWFRDLIQKKNGKKALKIIGVILAIPSTLFLILAIYFSFKMNMVYYDNAVALIEEANYEEAKEDLLKISESSKYFEKGLILQRKIDSIVSEQKILAASREKEIEQARMELENQMQDFRMEWADSVVKNWNGEFIVSYNEVSQNKIEFQLGKEASLYYESNRETHIPIMQKSFNNSLSNHFLIPIDSISTKISLIPNSTVLKELEGKQARKNRIDSQFSGWNGHHIDSKRIIQDNMHDPKSFEHVRTEYNDYGNYLIIYTTYRGKNAFGATILTTSKTKVDLEKTPIQLIE